MLSATDNANAQHPRNALRDHLIGHCKVWLCYNHYKGGAEYARRLHEGCPPDKALARKAIPAYIRSLCRAYTEESIRHLAAIMRQREDSPAARVQAADSLLDRGWGKPPQAHTGEDGK